MKTCIVCQNKHYGRGYCIRHYTLWKRNGSPFISKNPARGLPEAERFWMHVDKSSGCWLWIGASSNSYPSFRTDDGRLVKAHKYSFFLHGGEVDQENPFVLHSCDTPPCVNPDHLRSGSAKDNVSDMTSRKRHMNNRKTKCMNGHELDEGNVYIKKNGARACIPCMRNRTREWRAKNSTEALTVYMEEK